MSIGKLLQVIQTLETDINDKSTARDLDDECVMILQQRQLEVGPEETTGIFDEGDSEDDVGAQSGYIN